MVDTNSILTNTWILLLYVILKSVSDITTWHYEFKRMSDTTKMRSCKNTGTKGKRRWGNEERGKERREN